MKETVIKVKGMVCGGCENRVKNALSQIEGVKSVEASYKDGIVKIVASQNVEKKAMEETINEIGFEVINKN